MSAWVFFDWGGTLVVDTPEGVHAEPLAMLPHAREVLDDLSLQGYRFAIVTNTRSATRKDVEARLEGLGLRRRFPVVVTSLDAGIRKPDPRIFERALVEAGCRARDACMVGNDAMCDVAGAREAGLYAIYLDTERRGPALSPDATITTLAQLPGVVRAWRSPVHDSHGAVPPRATLAPLAPGDEAILVESGERVCVRAVVDQAGSFLVESDGGESFQVSREDLRHPAAVRHSGCGCCGPA